MVVVGVDVVELVVDVVVELVVDVVVEVVVDVVVELVVVVTDVILVVAGEVVAVFLTNTVNVTAKSVAKRRMPSRPSERKIFRCREHLYFALLKLNKFFFYKQVD